MNSNYDTGSEPRYEYVDDPVNFKALCKLIGMKEVAELLGYVPNSIAQMYDGRRKVRKFVEFAAEQYLLNQEKRASGDKLYIFTASPTSQQFNAIEAVADAVGIKITQL